MNPIKNDLLNIFLSYTYYSLYIPSYTQAPVPPTTQNSINSSIGGASIGFLFGWADEDANFGDALKNSAKGFEFV